MIPFLCLVFFCVCVFFTPNIFAQVSTETNSDNIMLRSGIRKEVHPVEKKGKFVQNEIENTEGNGIAE